MSWWKCGEHRNGCHKEIRTTGGRGGRGLRGGGSGADIEYDMDIEVATEVEFINQVAIWEKCFHPIS